MEHLENKTKIENQESTPKFHFIEIAEIEPAMVSLVNQLKEKIESGEYDTLISDDVGGRIPTLVLRKIIKELNPDQKIETYFIASGEVYLPTPADKEKYGELQKHLKKVTAKTKKALVVTQYIFTGKTLIRLASALKEAGVENFDIAVVAASRSFEKFEQKQKSVLRGVLGDNNLYVGDEEGHRLSEGHDKLGGVRKTEKYSPTPKRVVDAIPKDGRRLSMKEWGELFAIDEEFEKRRNYAPLTPEEFKEEIQRNINFAREDATLLADRVVTQVWAKEN